MAAKWCENEQMPWTMKSGASFTLVAVECVQNRKTGAAEAAEGVGSVRDALVELSRVDGVSLFSGQRSQKDRRMLCAFPALKPHGLERISAARSRMTEIWRFLKYAAGR